MKHLSVSAQASLQLSDEDRLIELRSHPWIWYPRAVEMMDALESLFTHPPSHRMPNMLITGKTNNGKTAIARAFLAQHAPKQDPKEEADSIPVVYIQAPPVPDERRFNAALLDHLRIPHKTNERADRMLFQLLSVMPRLGVRMLIVDEIHHVLAGNLQRQRAFLNVLKYIGNELQVPIVALGTEDALYALQSDSQLANRFVPTPLPEWKFDRDFLGFLASFEEILPLHRPSELTEVKLATRIFAMSEGAIGEIVELLRAAATEAIKTREERISVPLLTRLRWTEPSQRRARASQLI